MSGLVGDPLLAIVNLRYAYGTYRNLVVQFAACTYGVITMAAILLYAPFGYAASLLAVRVELAVCSPSFAFIAQPRLFTNEDVLKRLNGTHWLPARFSLMPVPLSGMLTASGYTWSEHNPLCVLVRKLVPWLRKMDDLEFCRMLKYITYLLTCIDFMSDLAVGMGMITHGVLWPGVCILILCQVDNLSAIVSYGIRTKATLRQHASLFAASLFEVPILALTILYGARSTDTLTIVISITATCCTVLTKELAMLNAVIMQRVRAKAAALEMKPSTTRQTTSTERPTEQDSVSSAYPV
ncbi:unnamed protein product [Vitrella brassicaformis CCMP3155]|uniref:Uncharacterized protein n=1 Tax=Vitrella brassicaformis (strain CCMP3155) TaxID=1169540 RepID=A0A0G4EPE8_VITBC|nr:unnamed protein product [Vitrella brassicaformis CCMP3155]|eukprot:CEL99697.1 unnamed protein product [Vitrella brassicaformis CCMP3155]